jgi:hypothetical protein
MSVVTQLYFQIVEENTYMFRPLSGWAIIRLRLEYRRKLIYYNGPPRKGPKHVVFPSTILKYSCVTTDIYTLNFY